MTAIPPVHPLVGFRSFTGEINMDYDKIKCVTCKHCAREEFIPQGHSEYTPELGDWECRKDVFEPTGCIPDVLSCEHWEHDRRGYPESPGIGRVPSNSAAQFNNEWELKHQAAEARRKGTK